MVRPTISTCPSETSSSFETEELSFDEKRVQTFTKQILQGRIFMGAFQEKRYVDSLKAYRDVIAIAREEHDLIQDILVVKKRIEDLYPTNHWVGITTPDVIGAPASYCVWTDLPQDVTLGSYWFQIRRAKFKDGETYLRVKIVRSVNDDLYRTPAENRLSQDDVLDMFVDVKKSLNASLRQLLTFANIKEVAVFVFMLLSALILSSFEILKYILEYLLKFLDQFSKLLNSATPLFQICANLIERLFKMLCMLVLYLFKGPSAPQQRSYQQQYVPYSNMRALPPANQRRGVIIEEIQ